MVLLAVPADATGNVAVTAPVLAVGMMGAAMIGAALSGRLWKGAALGLMTGVLLVLLARIMGVIAPPPALATAIAMVIASISFAARGALFARSSGRKGWWIALGVVAGEAAIVTTAFAHPGALPPWLLALLPAQWASIAAQAALSGADPLAASAVLLALGGTTASTLLVAALWPRRWPYLLMFSAWIGFSALVHQSLAAG
ncbi:MAG: hypothetical protein KAF27_02180 [Porphyrobacter sp.]|nr:hypothetical protein [Porphyrobacter sp.]